ncbi:hypothetical protein EZV73_21030 [Acidaminobacter sp. JC074]|uniref:hypothetical protein n=1 Tax=Acidaminobacter sp. JC074 TaxID=2530199 RepID=UPI001F10D265|nr:hypothetical protein [Acidaminobacter sp. JC074]MCH4890077.1 hypothetical protein [Acidaminobacter sp. JC074]
MKKRYIIIPVILVIGLFGFFKFKEYRQEEYMKEVLGVNRNLDVPFKITGDITGVSISYASVIYYDDYVYSATDWLSYGYDHEFGELPYEKGDKLGQILIDLKYKSYEGIPPDFSSTYDEGLEIFELKGVKKEWAFLLETKHSDIVFYRSHPTRNVEMTFEQILKMISDKPTIVGVEYRSEEDGSWMKTVEDKALMDLLNKELPGLSRISYDEMESEPYKNSSRIPINLILEDGPMIHIQVLPESKYASVFGGYIALSDEVIRKLQSFNHESYKRLSDILRYDEDEINYVAVSDLVNNQVVPVEDPEWLGRTFYSKMNYYRLIESEVKSGQKVLSVEIGKSETDYKVIHIYQKEDLSLEVEMDDKTYKVLKGKILYEKIMALMNDQ